MKKQAPEQTATSKFEQELGSKLLREYMQAARAVYKDGQTRDDFRAAMFTQLRFPIGDAARAPQWVHDFIDWLWDLFT